MTAETIVKILQKSGMSLAEIRKFAAKGAIFSLLTKGATTAELKDIAELGKQLTKLKK